MSNYTKATNFATKDSLATGNPSKIVKGTEIDTEFNAISSAIASKADLASPTFTGTPSAPTATTGSNTTQLANTAYVKQELASIPTTGRAVQTIASVFTGSYSVNSSTFSATGHTASITPTSASSKIIAMVIGGDNFNNNTNTGINNRATIYRDSTNLSGSSSVGLQNQSLGAEYGFDWANSMLAVDSPSSTSALTYQVYIRGNFNYSSTYAKSTLLLMEIL